MSGRQKTLPVPYFAQPTGITCQSTVLKMFAQYLENSVVLRSTGAGDREIGAIWKDINEGPGRPSKFRNAHANMKWWLEQRFPNINFEYGTETMPENVVEKIVGYVDRGFPVLVAVSHSRVEGHIILVVGYEGYMPNACSGDFRLVVDDPYGAFDPSLSSKMFGNRRFEGGASLLSGGQKGPGKEVKLAVDAINRHRKGDAYFGTYYMLSATGWK